MTSLGEGKKAAFPKKLKLTRRRDFIRLKKSGRQFKGKWIYVQSLKVEGRDETCLGLTVTRRFGKAHQRNRFKRLVREAFRLSQHQLPKGYDLNVAPRYCAIEATLQGILKDIQAFQS